MKSWLATLVQSIREAVTSFNIVTNDDQVKSQWRGELAI